MDKNLNNFLLQASSSATNEEFNGNERDMLWEAITILKDINETYATTKENVQKQLENLCVKDDDDNIRSLYVDLEDKYCKLQEDYNAVKGDFDAFKLNSETEINDLKKQHLENIEAIREESRNEIKQHEDTIRKLKEVIDNKEEEFFNEVHAIQAKTAIKYDEMETNLQNLIAENNKKLRDSNYSNSVLRSELMTVKNQYTTTINNMEKVNAEKISNLEDRVLFSENQLTIAQEKLFESRQSTITKYVGTKTKYMYDREGAAKNSRTNEQLIVSRDNSISNDDTKLIKPLNNVNKSDSNYKSNSINSTSHTDQFVNKSTTHYKENQDTSSYKGRAISSTSYTDPLVNKSTKKSKENQDTNSYKSLAISSASYTDPFVNNTTTRNIYKENENTSRSWKNERVPSHSTKSSGNSSIPKKRKLLEPKDLDYLNNLMNKPE